MLIRIAMKEIANKQEQLLNTNNLTLESLWMIICYQIYIMIWVEGILTEINKIKIMSKNTISAQRTKLKAEIKDLLHQY